MATRSVSPTQREKAGRYQDEEAALALRSTTLPPLRLSLNFFWTFLGNITQAVSRLLLLVVIVKWEGLETVGLWVLTTSLCSSVFTCCELGLRPLLICDVRREHPFQDYYSLRLVLALVGAVVLVAFGSFSYGVGATLALLTLVAAGRAFDSLSDICYGLLQREERMDRIGAGMALRYAGGMVGMLAALMLGYSLVIAVLEGLL